MFAAYRYAVRKIAASKLTWFILVFGIGLAFGIAGYLPMTFKLRGYTEIQTEALRLILAYVLGLGEVIILIIGVFAAFRAGSIFRDELQDGSLLVMLSKPISRSALLFCKWFGYSSALAVFCLLLTIAQTIGIAAGSRFQVRAGQLLLGALLVWLISLVFAWTFSGAALLLSAFLSSAKTSVTVLAIGLLFPLTALIGQTQVTRELKRPENGGRIFTMIGYTKLSDTLNLLVYESGADFLERLVKDGKNTLTSGTADQKAALFKFFDGVYKLKGLRDPVDPSTVTPESYEQNLRATDDWQANYLSNFYEMYLYIPSNRHDTYTNVVGVDLNGQAISLTDYIVSAFYSDYARNRLTIATDGSLGTGLMRALPDQTLTAELCNDLYDNQTVFSPLSGDSTEDHQGYIAAWKKDNERAFAAFGGKAHTIRYESYQNKDYVLAAYLSVGAGLTLVAILLLKRKNFA